MQSLLIKGSNPRFTLCIKYRESGEKPLSTNTITTKIGVDNVINLWRSYNWKIEIETITPEIET